jgi:hypothetical protein
MDDRTNREVREDVRADRSDALLDRMDSICDKLTEKLTSIAVSLAQVDVRLNNHLKHHEKLESHLLYPVALAIIIGMGTLIWSIIRVHI